MKRKSKLIILLILACNILFAQNPNNELFEITKIQNNIKSKRISSYDQSGNNNDRLTHIQDGEKAILLDVKGAGVINHIWLTIAPQQPNINRNDIIIRMYWDGNEFPSVESPIGSFFGQGWNESYNYASLPLAATPKAGNGLVSYFNMPFSNGARIEIENQAGKEIEAFYYYIDYYEFEKLPAGTGRFHAWFNHQLALAPDGGEDQWQVTDKSQLTANRNRNYLIADIKGKGHFVGVNYYIQSPSPVWYGEGDDMFFIDGDTEPTLHGTGTEDYFNTSWSPKELYSHPYFGYPRVNNETGFLGRTHVYRFHLSDPVYFEKSLKFSMEHGTCNNLTLDLASVAYWYLEKASPLPPALSKEERQPMPLIGPVQIYRWRQEWRINKGNHPDLWGNE